MVQFPCYRMVVLLLQLTSWSSESYRISCGAAPEMLQDKRQGWQQVALCFASGSSAAQQVHSRCCTGTVQASKLAARMAVTATGLLSFHLQFH